MIKERYSGRVKPELISLDPDEVVISRKDFFELVELGYRAYHLIDFAASVENLLPLAEHHSTLCHIDDKCFEDIKKAKDLLNKFKELK